MKRTDLAKLLLWDVLNPIMLNFRKRKKYHFPKGCKGLNLGCGASNIPGWVGIDGGIAHQLMKKWPKWVIKPLFKFFNMSANYTFDQYMAKYKNVQIIHHELKNGIPFPDNSVANIYSSHFFEHLFKKDAEKLLLESYRVLKQGGIIRICVPSLKIEVEEIKNAIRKYEDGDIMPIQKYVTSEITGFNDVYSNHRWMYVFRNLNLFSRMQGFLILRNFPPKTETFLTLKNSMSAMDFLLKPINIKNA